MRRGLLLCGCIFMLTSSCDWFDKKKFVCDPLGPKPSLKLLSSTNVSSCQLPDGGITVDAVGGTPPYRFKVNDGAYQSNGNFTKLPAGQHLVSVLDINGCESFQEVKLDVSARLLTATATTTPDNQCFADNGTIKISTRNGKPPYSFSLDGVNFQEDSTFYLLPKEIYPVVVRDGASCRYLLRVRVERGSTGVSYANNVGPIISANCATSGCHNGDAGFTLNFTVFDNVRVFAPRIKGLVSQKISHRGQPPLLQQEIDFISCWADDGAPNN